LGPCLGKLFQFPGPDTNGIAAFEEGGSDVVRELDELIGVDSHDVNVQVGSRDLFEWMLLTTHSLGEDQGPRIDASLFSRSEHQTS
jgi:hypothetical protein